MERHLDDPDPESWEVPPRTAPLWRVRILAPAVLLLAVVVSTWWAVGWLTSPAGPTGPGAPEAAAVGTELGTEPGEAEREASGPVSGGTDVGPSGGTDGGAPTVTVHVVGEVAEPGLVQLPQGARVHDALEAAGGPTSDAVVAAVNLAAPVTDGSQIRVPGPGEGADPVAGGAGDAGAGAVAGTGTVDVNTADASALEELPGIGPALAARIIDHREGVGPFTSMEDLDAVSGIGPAMMERLDGLVSW